MLGKIKFFFELTGVLASMSQIILQIFCLDIKNVNFIMWF